MRNDLDKILADMKIEIENLKRQVLYLRRELNTRTSGDAAAKARRIPVVGETYYIKEDGNAYLKDIYLDHLVIYETGLYYRFNIDTDDKLVIEYSTDGTTWNSAGAELTGPPPA